MTASTRRRRYRLILVIVALLATVPILDSCFSAPHYDGPPSDHFDGEAFVNRVEREERGFLPFLRWQLTRERGDWDAYTAETASTEIVERVEGDELRVTFVNHATVLIQTAGINLLTDPIWAERASPVTFAGPKRHVDPGIPFDSLPPIDVVVISHNHYDHLDLVTLERLAAEHAPTILVPLGNAALLEAEGIPGGVDVDWWDGVPMKDAVVTCVPAEHFSGRSFSDRDRTLWAGFVLQAPGGVVYFAGDTGVGPHFEEVRERFGSPRLAILPIGAYLPRWFMSPVHIDPREAAEAHLALGAATSLAIHFGCFEMADEGPLDPVNELAVALEELEIPSTDFWVLAHGEARSVP